MQKQRSVSRSYLVALCESALLIAVGFALSYLVVWEMPQGGTVTPVSLLPLLLIGQRRGARWAFPSAVVYAGLQMLQHFWAPPVKDFISYFGVVMLDYVVAFGVFGFSFLFRKQRYGLMFAAPICYLLRFLSHFTVGVIVWGEVANWRDAAAVKATVLYSAAYNGSFLAVDMALVLIAGFFLCQRGLLRYGLPRQ